MGEDGFDTNSGGDTSGDGSWQADLGDAYAGSFTDPAAAPPADNTAPPAASSGWDIEGLLKSGADKALGAYQSFNTYRSAGASANAAARASANAAELERARIEAARQRDQAQLRADNMAAQLQLQARQAAAKVQSFLSTPAGIATAIGAAFFAFRILARR